MDTPYRLVTLSSLLLTKNKSYGHNLHLGHILQGHKVILSACSPYFKKILRDNPCRHPVLILNDMDLEVKYILDLTNSYNFFHLPT